MILAPVETETHGLGHRLALQLDALTPAVLGGALLLALVMFALAWATSWGIDALATRVASDLGPLRKPIARAAAWLRFVVIVAAAAVPLWPLFARAPLVVSSCVVLLAVLAVVLAPGLSRDLAAGIAFARRGTFSEGDTIEVAGVRGRVVELGTWRTTLATDGGAQCLLPNRELMRGAVRVAAVGGATHIRTVVPSNAPLDAAALERFRRAALASPFRIHGGSVLVEREGDGVRIEIETWAGSAAPDLARRIARSIESPPPRDEERSST